MKKNHTLQQKRNDKMKSHKLQLWEDQFEKEGNQKGIAHNPFV